jgi:hypothetical protein
MLRNSAGNFRLTPRKIWTFTQRQIVQWTLLLRYAILNRTSRSPIIDGEGQVIVSLTTFGMRLRTVYLALESIAAGDSRPYGIILWVDAADMSRAQSLSTLRRLRGRGLQIRAADASLGSHKKYYHFVHSAESLDYPLVTADDDIFYPSGWLASLVSAYRSGNGRTVVSSWVKRVSFEDCGFAPYDTWPSVNEVRTDARNYFMSGSGTIYPIALAARLREGGTEFMSCTPKADDIWLNMQAADGSFSVRQALVRSLHIWSVPRSQRIKLSTVNVIESLNDVQLSATFSPELIQRVRSDR